MTSEEGPPRVARRPHGCHSPCTEALPAMNEPGLSNGDESSLPTAEVPPPAAVPVVAADSAPPAPEATPVAVVVEGPAPAAEVPAEAPAAPSFLEPSTSVRRALRARWPGRARRGRGASSPESPPGPAEAPTASLAPEAPAPEEPRLAAVAPAATPANGPPPVEALDERLRRLESVLVKLADTRTEVHVTEKPAEKADAAAAPVASLVPTALREAGKLVLPAAIEAVMARSAVPAPEAKPAVVPPVAPSPTPEPRSPWLLVDIVTELRSILHMYGDPRYRLTWPGRLIPALMLVLIFTSWLWLPGTSVLPTSFSTTIDKIFDLVLAYFLFKVLSRESRRYRETIPPAVP